MKKLFALILALAMVLSLAACGGSGDAQAPADAPQEAPQESRDALALGAEVDVGFAKFTFDGAQVTYKLGGSSSYRPATDGMQFFCLTGTIQNTGGSELPMYYATGSMTFNGTYNYPASGAVIYSDGYNSTLPALMSGTFILYAEVPDALFEQLQDCTVEVAFNENFAGPVQDIADADYHYEVYLDEAVCAKAQEEPPREMQYFEECPILPTPLSFADSRQSSRSTSSTNGKLTSIRYSFGVNMGSREDINSIYEKYMAGVASMGFTVQGGDIYAGSKLVATVTLESDFMKFEIIPGNEDLEAPVPGEAPGKVQSGDTEIALGTAIENDYVYMLLDSTGCELELCSGSSNYGTYTYYTSDNGDPYFYLSGTFKNLGGTPVDLRNVFVTFTFDDKYTYAGDSDGFASGNSSFVHDVSPLSSVNCYIYAAVPQELIDSYSTCVVRIGFTEDFNYTTVDVNDLPKFEYCDDIYTITLTR